MEKLLEQLKALQASIATYQGRIETLESQNQQNTELKALVDSQREELDKLIAKVEKQGIAGINKGDSDRIKAIASFAALARGNFKDAMRSSSNEDGGFLITPEIEAGILTLCCNRRIYERDC